MPETRPARHTRHIVRAAASWIGIALLAFLTVAALGWSLLAIVYSDLSSAFLRGSLAIAFVVACVLACALVRPWRCAWLVLVGLFLAVLAWFLFTPASNSRNWQRDVAILPTIEIDGDRMTIRGVRDTEYRSETDFDVRWEDRTYDLARLRTLDLFMSYWGPTLICHTFVSFGFEADDGSMDYLCASIETRKEVGETYSAVKGLFRQYELIYVFADERDIVRVRTNFRGEHVHLYRIETTPEAVRALLGRYTDAATSLHARPRWYNAVTESCGVDILRAIDDVDGGKIRTLSLDSLLNGLWDELAYRNGAFGFTKSLEEIRAQSLISPEAIAASEDEFSEAIRRDLVHWRPRREVLPGTSESAPPSVSTAGPEAPAR